jgi:hypothetical protein
LPYKTPERGWQPQPCEVCGSPANRKENGYYLVVDCSRCGDFQMGREALVNSPLTSRDEQQRALASHLVRRMQGSKRPILDYEFFASLSQQKLPTPTEMSDNLLVCTENSNSDVVMVKPAKDRV